MKVDVKNEAILIMCALRPAIPSVAWHIRRTTPLLPSHLCRTRVRFWLWQHGELFLVRVIIDSCYCENSQWQYNSHYWRLVMRDVVCWRRPGLLWDLRRDLYNETVTLREEAQMELSYMPNFSVFFVSVCTVYGHVRACRPVHVHTCRGMRGYQVSSSITL